MPRKSSQKARKSGKPVKKSTGTKKTSRGTTFGTAQMYRVSAPTATNVVRSHAQQQTIRSTRDSTLGDGIVVCGTEMLRYARTNDSGTSYSGRVLTLGLSDAATQFAQLAPELLYSGFSQLQTFALLFGLYRYRKIRVRYVPTVGTQTEAMITFGLLFDGGAIVVTSQYLTSSIISRLPYVVETPVWQQAEVTVPVCPRYYPAYFCDCPVALDSSAGRQAIQATLLAYVDNTADTVTYGRFYLDYEIEFYQRGTPNNGVSLSQMISVLDEKEIEVIRDRIRQQQIPRTGNGVDPRTMRVLVQNDQLSPVAVNVERNIIPLTVCGPSVAGSDPINIQGINGGVAVPVVQGESALQDRQDEGAGIDSSHRPSAPAFAAAAPANIARGAERPKRSAFLN